ncbi:MAG: penicillin acylase family protein [Calditrichia bacterium]
MGAFIKKTILMLLIVLLGIGTFVFLQIQKLRPVYETEVEIPDLTDTVNVYWDSTGVPHIEAENEHDLLIAAGYVTARERLFQMEMTRRMASGRLSEIIGPPTVKFDKFFRTLGLDSLAIELYNDSSEESRQWCNWYAQGINAFINEGNWPVEFSILDISPQRWRPSDCWLPARLMAWFMNFSWKGDWLYGELHRVLPEALFREILPRWESGPDILTKTEHLSSMSEIIQMERDARKFLHWPDGPIGSNNWVVSPALNEGRGAVLANDPHLHLQFPPVWFEMHWKSPQLQAAGFSLPGSPGIVIGRNNHLAWGVTNGMIDDCDLFLLTLDSASSAYQFDGKKLPLKKQLLQINVKGEDPVFLERFSTLHGPLINGLLNKKYRKTGVALKWSGHYLSDEILSFIRLAKSQNWEEFKRAFDTYTVPCQNMVYADKDGNIGYRLIGKIPLRSYKIGILPVDGTKPKNEWTGWLQEEQQPTYYNPPKGYIVTANNRIGSNLYFSEMWEPPFRAQRIAELLEELQPLTLKDHQRIQNDVLNLFAREHLPSLLKVIKGNAKIQKDYPEPILLLEGWNYEMRPESVAAAIFEYWQKMTIKYIFQDEMGPELFGYFTDFPGFYWRIYEQIIRKQKSGWYDNVNTPDRESREDILVSSFFAAMDSLKKWTGAGISTWEWGNLHQLELEHPLGKIAVTRLAFNKGPKPSPGNPLTVNVGGYKFKESFSHKIGASLRFIMDWTTPNRYYKILPGGNSGRFLSPFYGDQYWDWLKGNYKITVLQKYRKSSKMVLKKKKNI